MSRVFPLHETQQLNRVKAISIIPITIFIISFIPMAN